MKSVKSIAALIAVLLFATAALAQDNPPKSNGGTPKLLIDSPVHDFGEVKPGSPLRYTFKLKNEGTADLLIQNVQPG
jgi:hypothetical protein